MSGQQKAAVEWAGWEAARQEISGRDFEFLRSAISSLTGIHLTEAKTQLVLARLRSRVTELGLSTIAEYRRMLESLPPGHPEWQEFTNRLTTNKTDWFREPAHFDFLVREVLPAWKALGKGRELQIWSAACSTGEEPYTLSMVLGSAQKRGELSSFRIQATDVDTDVLGRARKGIYSRSGLALVPQEFQRSSFAFGTEGIEHLMKVSPQVRDAVTFEAHNLSQFPYPWRGKFPVIFCRNVFIYFTRELVAKILEGLYEAAAANAVLFIGHSESVQGMSRWRYVGPSIYAKGTGLGSRAGAKHHK